MSTIKVILTIPSYEELLRCHLSNVHKYSEIVYLGDMNFFALGFCYYTGANHFQKNIPEAICQYEKAVKFGNAKAMCALGYIFSDSFPEKSFQWYFEASKLNDSEAVNEIGNFYLISENISLAVEYYMKGVELKNSDSMVSLASIYREKNDISAAIDLYEKAAKLENKEAVSNLIYLYMDIDKEKAVFWLDKFHIMNK